jgi:hypothetical protein
MRKHFDFWAIVVIVLTLLLFVVALFERGLPHDLLLESGVFLVSVKLIMMSHKNSVIALRVDEHLTQIQDMLRDMQDRQPS